MALECVCYPAIDPRMVVVQKQAAQPDRRCRDPKRDAAAEESFDICKIVERTRQHEQKKHDDRECHFKGERRQNIVNKLKMFLDDCDDRPVLKRRSEAGAVSGVGQTGFGPMIKYPGYVDYGHPYFSHPYDKLPELATTVGQRGGANPCPPVSVRNWDSSRGAEAHGATGAAGRGQKGEADGCCRCAQRRSVPPKCPAACRSSGKGAGPTQPAGGRPHPNTGRPQPGGGAMICECTYEAAPRGPPATGALPDGGLRYYCCPMPED